MYTQRFRSNEQMCAVVDRREKNRKIEHQLKRKILKKNSINSIEIGRCSHRLLCNYKIESTLFCSMYSYYITNYALIPTYHLNIFFLQRGCLSPEAVYISLQSSHMCCAYDIQSHGLLENGMDASSVHFWCRTNIAADFYNRNECVVSKPSGSCII